MMATIISRIGHGIEGTIAKIRGNGEFHRRLINTGLRCGCAVEIDKSGLSKNRILIHYSGGILPLSPDETDRIYVEFTDNSITSIS